MPINPFITLTFLSFQFLNGAIKRVSDETTGGHAAIFQFLNGAIKRSLMQILKESSSPFQFLNGAIKRKKDGP